MPKYVDGFVIPVPKKKIAAYRKIAQLASKVWRDHGALDYFECVLEDNTVPCGMPFPKLAKTKPGETVVFAWIVYKSRAHRDKVNARVMADKRMTGFDMKTMPFDIKRMTFGGFDVLVEAKGKA
jgi:uncharacterized protein YbaA (DUF1428 family)